MFFLIKKNQVTSNKEVLTKLLVTYLSIRKTIVSQLATAMSDGSRKSLKDFMEMISMTFRTPGKNFNDLNEKIHHILNNF